MENFNEWMEDLIYFSKWKENSYILKYQTRYFNTEDFQKGVDQVSARRKRIWISNPPRLEFASRESNTWRKLRPSD